MTDNEFHDEDESFQGYTDEQAGAIRQAIKSYLKAGADFHGKILFSIGQVVDAVSGGGTHPQNVLYECDNEDGLTALLAKLDAAEQEYDQLPMPYRHILRPSGGFPSVAWSATL